MPSAAPVERGARGSFDLVFTLVASMALWGLILLGAWALLF